MEWIFGVVKEEEFEEKIKYWEDEKVDKASADEIYWGIEVKFDLAVS